MMIFVKIIDFGKLLRDRTINRIQFYLDVNFIVMLYITVKNFDFD